METFSALLPLCAGNSPVTGEFLAQRPVTLSFDVFFDLHLNKRLSKNRDAGDLRRHRAHYDVIVMYTPMNLLHFHHIYIHTCFWLLWKKITLAYRHVKDFHYKT